MLNPTDLSPSSSVGRSVGMSVCLSGGCTVAKRLIGSGCSLGGEWGRSMDGYTRWVEIVEWEGAVFLGGS